MKCKLLDIKTGRRAWSDWDESAYWWADGNGGCDCNREPTFEVKTDLSGTCIGYQRYIVIDASPGMEDPPMSESEIDAFIARANEDYSYRLERKL